MWQSMSEHERAELTDVRLTPEQVHNIEHAQSVAEMNCSLNPVTHAVHVWNSGCIKCGNPDVPDSLRRIKPVDTCLTCRQKSLNCDECQYVITYQAYGWYGEPHAIKKYCVDCWNDWCIKYSSDQVVDIHGLARERRIRVRAYPDKNEKIQAMEDIAHFPFH